MADSLVALTKLCRKCGQTKALDEFAARVASKNDGRQKRCRACQAVINADWRANNPGFHRKYRDKQKVYAARYHAENVDKITARKAAYYAEHPEKQTERGRRCRAKNPDYERLRHERWRNANPEKSRGLLTAWRKANPETYSVQAAKRKARKLSAPGTHTRSEIRTLLESQGYLCANPYCAADLRVKRRCLDHIEALAVGGSNDISNLQWLCRNCNSRKCALNINLWLERERKRAAVHSENA